MVTLGELLIPIAVASVLVFLVSAIIHMVLKYHNKDYTSLPNEEAVRQVIRAGNPAPAQYVIPHCPDMKEMEKPEVKQKYNEGPVAVIYLLRPGVPNMGKYLSQWFLFILIVSLFIAYVVAHAIPRGAEYLHVFRIVGAIGFLAYGMGNFTSAIWWGKPWRVAVKEAIDGLVYGLVTAGVFGWLWPQ